MEAAIFWNHYLNLGEAPPRPRLEYIIRNLMPKQKHGAPLPNPSPHSNPSPRSIP